MRLALLITLLYGSVQLFGQNWDSISIYTDTLYHHSVVHLDAFVYVEQREYTSAEEYRTFWRTRYYVNRVLPFARQALTLLREAEDSIATFEKRRHEKRYIRQTYKQLKAMYKEPLKDMYVEEGRILVKIIERETGAPFFELVREFKGLDDAMFWQGVAKVNGYSLKEGYDPEKEPQLERILSAIEAGVE